MTCVISPAAAPSSGVVASIGGMAIGIGWKLPEVMSSRTAARAKEEKPPSVAAVIPAPSRSALRREIGPIAGSKSSVVIVSSHHEIAGSEGRVQLVPNVVVLGTKHGEG